MSGYPAHPLAKVSDTKSDEKSSYAEGEYPQIPYPNYPTNPDGVQQGVEYNNPNMGYQGDSNFPGHPGYPNQSGYPNQPGYPGQHGYAYQPSYPNQPGYPSQSGYPNQPPPAYPGLQQQTFPGQPGFQQPSYPGQPGFQQPSYPSQPGFQQPGFPIQPGFQQPGLPGQQGFQQPNFPDPRGFIALNPIDGKGNDGDASNPMLGDVVENGGIDAGHSFSDKKIRHAFVKKVYLILSAQLLCTLAFVALFIFHNDVKRWVQRNTVFYWASYGIFIVTYFMLACPCCMGIRRRWPWNFICLTLFTLAMSYMTGTISCFYQTDIVLIALAVTTGVCIAISIFAIQTKIDFTLCHGVLFVFSIVFFLFGIACLLVYRFLGPNYILQVVYGSIGALMFSLFLLVDTQTIIGGKNRKHQISPEEYIFGALQLYLDIVNLFLMLLKVIGTKKN